MRKSEIISKNLKETEKIAQEFLKQLTARLNLAAKGATVVGLYGELGTGKTAFTKAAGELLGVKKKISSPTFVIMKRYPLQHKNFKNLFHLDAYRLKKKDELLHLGWKEIVADPGYLVFIEWPERVAKIMPKAHHKIKISHTKDGHRKFKLNLK